ncbi:MAG: hypothetical protein H6883_08095 [Rhodobiaceae bacterium]|nr:hypothetical protein [Rhodobiaceae bacterium]MCC0056083.1 hypothetical protein [Rhodobiaceae bacterium]
MWEGTSLASDRRIKPILKPLVESDASLYYFKSHLIITPVRHILINIKFGSGYQRIKCFLSFEPLCHYHPNRVQYCHYFYKLPLGWITDHPGDQDRYLAKLQHDAIPEMKKIVTLDQCVELWDRLHPMDSTMQLRAIGHAMQGDFGEASRNLVPAYNNVFNEWHSGVGQKLADEGENFSKADRRVLLALMHRREAENARQLKLEEKYWEPSLFPAEITYPELRVLRPDGTVMDD